MNYVHVVLVERHWWNGTGGTALVERHWWNGTGRTQQNNSKDKHISAAQILRGLTIDRTQVCVVTNSTIHGSHEVNFQNCMLSFTVSQAFDSFYVHVFHFEKPR
jgi:hypothetical protein